MTPTLFAMPPAPAASSKRSTASAPVSFRNATDFVPAYRAALEAIGSRYGREYWHLHPAAYVWARVPDRWLAHPIKDRRLPAAEFWPGGRLPVGPVYAPPPPPAKPSYPVPATPEAVAAWAKTHGLVLFGGIWVDPWAASLEQCRLDQIAKDCDLREEAELQSKTATARAACESVSAGSDDRAETPPDATEYAEAPDIVRYLETVAA